MLFYIFSVSLSTILDMKDRKKFNGKKPAKRNVERLLDRARWYYSCRLRSSHEEKNRICYDLFWSVSQSFFLFCTISIEALQFFVVPYNVKAIDNSVKIYYNNLCGLFRGTNFEV